MSDEGPYLSVAALCEVVLHEKSEMISCIRFLDTMNVTVPPNTPEPFAVPLRVNGFIAFKSGNFVGNKIITVRLQHPSGKTSDPDKSKPFPSFPMVFKGAEHGHNLILQLELVVDQSGLFMFDVLLDEEVITRIPLKVNITRMTQPQTEPESSSQKVQSQA